MEKEIRLKSRDDIKNYLVKIEIEDCPNDAYSLKTDFPYRTGITNTGNHYIDPSGGPFMVEGMFLEEANSTIKYIGSSNKYGDYIMF